MLTWTQMQHSTTKYMCLMCLGLGQYVYIRTIRHYQVFSFNK